MQPTLLILAAGMGSRYGGLKQVDPVGPNGEAIIDYSIFDAIRSGFGKVVFVIRKSFADAFKETFDPKLTGKIEVEYVYQELDDIPEGYRINPDRTKPWGTGHAVLVARNAISEPFVVINADDFYGPNSYKLLKDHFDSTLHPHADLYSMVGYELQYTLSDFGYVSRGVCETDENGYLQSVVERTQIEKAGNEIHTKIDDSTTMTMSGREVVSMNIWGFSPDFFGHLENYFKDFISNNYQNPKAEFYIPFVVNELIKKKIINLKVLESRDRWFGVTYKEDKAIAVDNINTLIKQGVYPEKLW